MIMILRLKYQLFKLLYIKVIDVKRIIILAQIFRYNAFFLAFLTVKIYGSTCQIFVTHIHLSSKFCSFYFKISLVKSKYDGTISHLIKVGGGKYYPPLKNCVRMDGKEKMNGGKYRFNISKAGNLRAFQSVQIAPIQFCSVLNFI